MSDTTQTAAQVEDETTVREANNTVNADQRDLNLRTNGVQEPKESVVMDSGTDDAALDVNTLEAVPEDIRPISEDTNGASIQATTSDIKRTSDANTDNVVEHTAGVPVAAVVDDQPRVDQLPQEAPHSSGRDDDKIVESAVAAADADIPESPNLAETVTLATPPSSEKVDQNVAVSDTAPSTSPAPRGTLQRANAVMVHSPLGSHSAEVDKEFIAEEATLSAGNVSENADLIEAEIIENMSNHASDAKKTISVNHTSDVKKTISVTDPSYTSQLVITQYSPGKSPHTTKTMYNYPTQKAAPSAGQHTRSSSSLSNAQAAVNADASPSEEFARAMSPAPGITDAIPETIETEEAPRDEIIRDESIRDSLVAAAPVVNDDDALVQQTYSEEFSPHIGNGNIVKTQHAAVNLDYSPRSINTAGTKSTTTSTPATVTHASSPNTPWNVISTPSTPATSATPISPPHQPQFAVSGSVYSNSNNNSGMSPTSPREKAVVKVFWDIENATLAATDNAVDDGSVSVRELLNNVKQRLAGVGLWNTRYRMDIYAYHNAGLTNAFALPMDRVDELNRNDVRLWNIGSKRGQADHKLKRDVDDCLEDACDHGLRVACIVIISGDSDFTDTYRRVFRARVFIPLVVIHPARVYAEVRELAMENPAGCTTWEWNSIKYDNVTGGGRQGRSRSRSKSRSRQHPTKHSPAATPVGEDVTHASVTFHETAAIDDGVDGDAALAATAPGHTFASPAQRGRRNRSRSRSRFRAQAAATTPNPRPTGFAAELDVAASDVAAGTVTPNNLNAIKRMSMEANAGKALTPRSTARSTTTPLPAVIVPHHQSRSSTASRPLSAARRSDASHTALETSPRASARSLHRPSSASGTPDATRSIHRPSSASGTPDAAILATEPSQGQLQPSMSRHTHMRSSITSVSVPGLFRPNNSRLLPSPPSQARTVVRGEAAYRSGPILPYVLPDKGLTSPRTRPQSAARRKPTLEEGGRP